MQARIGAPLLIIALALLLASITVSFNRWSSARMYESEKDWNSIPSVRAVSETDHVLGNIRADIEVIIFSDPECPYCKEFHNESLPRLLGQFGDSIVVSYRHFLLPRYTQSPYEALAMECAGIIGGNEGFWKYTDALYSQTPSHNRLEPSMIFDFANLSGVDPVQFSQCVEKEEGSRLVEIDRQEAAFAGITISPTIIVRSKKDAVLLPGSWYGPIEGAIMFFLKQQEGQ